MNLEITIVKNHHETHQHFLDTKKVLDTIEADVVSPEMRCYSETQAKEWDWHNVLLRNLIRTTGMPEDIGLRGYAEKIVEYCHGRRWVLVVAERFPPMEARRMLDLRERMKLREMESVPINVPFDDFCVQLWHKVGLRVEYVRRRDEMIARCIERKIPSVVKRLYPELYAREIVRYVVLIGGAHRLEQLLPGTRVLNAVRDGPFADDMLMPVEQCRSDGRPAESAAPDCARMYLAKVIPYWMVDVPSSDVESTIQRAYRELRAWTPRVLPTDLANRLCCLGFEERRPEQRQMIARYLLDESIETICGHDVRSLL